MQVTVPSFAKLNLDLRVLGKRPDQFHELRTIFQTISLQDTLGISFQFSKRPAIEIESSVDIAENLVVRAAKLVMDALKLRATVKFKLLKRIPMGAGLGGGSSNAAAVLLALPFLAGKRLPRYELAKMAESLGSDIPFFLLGGTAVALGRGTELHPLPDLPALAALVVSTGAHVSTANAYQSLKRSNIHDVTNALTSPSASPILREFQSITWALGNTTGPRLANLPLRNDFEDVVFQTHPELANVVRKLRRLGARPALMTGSGSSIFGVFESRSAARLAAASFPAGQAVPVRFLSRRRYQYQWQKALLGSSKEG